MKKLLLLVSVLSVNILIGKVDINTASVKELTTLKGIGDAKAKAIVNFRKSKCFKTLDDLTLVKGIGKSIIKNNKDEIKIGKCPKNTKITNKNIK